MKKKTNIVYSFILLLLIVGGICIALNDKDNKLKDLIKDENGKYLFGVTLDVDLSLNLENTEIMYELVDFVALVRIDSVDGVTNFNPILKEYVMPYSYGKATVLQLFKGKIENDVIEYTRGGGTMPYDEWIKGEDNPEKLLELKEKSEFKNIPNSKIVVQTGLNGDITLEIGKIYLV